MWNGAGELASYNDSSDDMTAATYDGDGLRTSATTNSGGTQDYVWNTLPEVPQMIQDSTNAYIYAVGTAPAEQVSLSTGTVTYLITDSLGSVLGTVNSSGTLTRGGDCHAFRCNSPRRNVVQRLGWSSKWNQSELPSEVSIAAYDGMLVVVLGASSEDRAEDVVALSSDSMRVCHRTFARLA